jgi:hypothetical protein
MSEFQPCANCDHLRRDLHDLHESRDTAHAAHHRACLELALQQEVVKFLKARLEEEKAKQQQPSLEALLHDGVDRYSRLRIPTCFCLRPAINKCRWLPFQMGCRQEFCDMHFKEHQRNDPHRAFICANCHESRCEPESYTCAPFELLDRGIKRLWFCSKDCGEKYRVSNPRICKCGKASAKACNVDRIYLCEACASEHICPVSMVIFKECEDPDGISNPSKMNGAK